MYTRLILTKIIGLAMLCGLCAGLISQASADVSAQGEGSRWTLTLTPGDFSQKADSPDSLTCVTADLNSGLVYAQQVMGYAFYVYDPAADAWSALASAPLSSGNNGGAAYLGGKVYTAYTGNADELGVYDIDSNTWITIPNGLGAGTGVIASDGTYLYLAKGTSFKKYNPSSNIWGDLSAPSIDIQAWGGMAFWNGYLYAHRGNGNTDYAKYGIVSGIWTTLPSLPDGAVLGSAIDPVRSVYYAYGNYGGTSLYAFDLDSQVWSTLTIPYFSVNDGGLAYAPQKGFTGIYFVEGEAGPGFARLETVPLQVGDFTFLPYAPARLTCVAADPLTGLIYAQQDNGTDFYAYDPLRNTWTMLLDAPLNSGNNGGAAYLDGKIYTTYTGNDVNLGVYDIASNTWSTIPNGLGAGTGAMASDGTYLYLAAPGVFKRYDPIAISWTSLATPCIDIEKWGGMVYWSGRLYAHRGNGDIEFARYEILSDDWATLPSLPAGAVLGSAIDPVRHRYYAYGSYAGSNWYIFNLDNESWSMESMPFFAVQDGGMAYAARGRVSGVYFVKGEAGVGFGRYQDASPSTGGFAINDGASYVNTTAVMLDILAEDHETGVSQMRFRNETPWRALVFQDALPWRSDALQQVLEGNGMPYDQLASSAITTTELAAYSQVIIPSDQPQCLYDAYNLNRSKFENYASSGGLVEFHAAAWGMNAGDLTGILLPGGVSIIKSSSDYNYLVEPGHPLVAGLSNPFYGSWASHGYFTDLPGGSLTISSEGSIPGGEPTLVEYALGAGSVIASGQTMEYSWKISQESGRILENMLPYLTEHTSWVTATAWTLTPGDGEKTVYGQFNNGGGLWSAAYTDTIVLDTQLPSSGASCDPQTSELSFQVSWSGSDTLSGVAAYDVQYRLGSDGTWTDWPGLTGTTQTSAIFGPDDPVTVWRDRTYYFRVRAHDNAGNIEGYEPAGDCSIYIELIGVYLPVVVRK